MRTKILRAPLVLIFLLCGCATAYHSGKNPLLGVLGGAYWDARGPGELTEVAFFGNGGQDQSTVARFITYRCAQLASKRGTPYFRMYEDLDEAIADIPTLRPIVGASGNHYGDYVYMLPESRYRSGDISTKYALLHYSPNAKN